MFKRAPRKTYCANGSRRNAQLAVARFLAHPSPIYLICLGDSLWGSLRSVRSLRFFKVPKRLRPGIFWLLALAHSAYADIHSPSLKDDAQQADQYSSVAKGNEQEPSPTLADPLAPVMAMTGDLSAPAAQPSLPRLTMIVRNPYQHYAMIDGQPRRVGDGVAGHRVLAIHPGSVLLQREDGQTLELDLYANIISKKIHPNPGSWITSGGQSGFASK